MLKKMGMVGVGVTAGLLAAAPFASATECPDGGHDGGGHNKGFNADCDFAAGHANAVSGISGDSMANIVSQAPLAGNNVGNIADCSNFLNGNLNGNFSGNNVALIGSNYAPSHVLSQHKLDSHKVDSHKLDGKKLDSHKVDSHKVDSHKVDSHKVDSHKVDSHKVDSHKVDSHKVDSKKLDGKKLDSHKVDSHKLNGKSAATPGMLSF